MMPDRRHAAAPASAHVLARARANLAWAQVPAEALDRVEVRGDGVDEQLAPLLRADGREQAAALWPPVADELVALLVAVVAAARWWRGSPPDPPPVDAAATVRDCLTLPLQWRRGAVPELRVVGACDGLVALQTPTQAHRELLAACIGDDREGDEPLTVWAAMRSAASAEQELQLCSIPALAVGEPRAARPQPLPAPRGGRSAAAASTRALPLEGIRAVELGGLWAAPQATRVLADLGAEVIKVEMPQRPDGMRTGLPAHYDALNAGKRLLELDLREPDAVVTLRRLLGPATVVVENLSPRVLDNLGLAPLALAADTGAAVVSMPVRGARRGAPPPQRVALGSTIELAAGLGLRNPATGLPGCAPVPFTDALAGIAGALATIAALRRGACSVRLAQIDDIAAPLAGRVLTRR